MNHNRNRMLFITLALIFFLCFFIWQVKADMGSEIVVRSDTPEWDLRSIDMGAHYVRLAGGVAEYVPEAFLSPEEFDKSPNIQTGVPKNAAEYYTARIRLLVPDGQPYAITFASVDYADSIYINGKHMQTVGHPGTSAAEAAPQTMPVYYTVFPEDGIIEALHQSSNFVHKEGGNPAGLRIGSVESVGRYFARETLTTAIIIGACLLLFIVHIVLYVLQRSYRANLYFSLFCLVWALRVGVTGAKTITALFPAISWYAAFRIEYAALPLACILIVLALSEMFDGLLQRPAKIAILCVNAAAAMLFLVAPTLFMTHALPFVQGLMLLSAAYVIVRFLMQLKARRDVPHIVMLCALFVFVYLSVREILYHNNVLIFPLAYSGMMDFAALVLVLFQMVAAFYGTVREVEAAKQRQLALELQSAQLALRNERISALIKQMEASPEHFLSVGPLALDIVAQRAFIEGCDLLLTPKEFALLLLLAQNEGRLVTSEKLYQSVWKQEMKNDGNALWKQVSNLKKKLGAQGGGVVELLAIRGKGYMLDTGGKPPQKP